MARRLTDGTDLVAVAKRQRELLWIILFGIGLYVLALGFAGVSPAMAIVAGLLYLLFQLASIIQIVRLAAALQTSLGLRIVYILLLFIPLLNLFVLLLVSGQANSVLKAAGVRVGFMGVPASEYPKLTTGHCRGCGYDRTGLELLQACPECGRVPQVV